MKVLMFGWEFPPHITGGLGTACFGMTKGLAKNGVDVLFVVPKAHGDEDETNVRLLNASDVTVNIDNEKDRSYWDRVQYMRISLIFLQPSAQSIAIRTERELLCC